jgi:hypothetical protein
MNQLELTTDRTSVCEHINKNMKVSSSIGSAGAIDGQTPFSILNEVYNTETYSKQEL